MAMDMKMETGMNLLEKMDISTKLFLASNLIILAVIYLMQYDRGVILWIAWVEFAIAVFGLGVTGKIEFLKIIMTLFYVVVLAITYLFIVINFKLSPDEMNVVTAISIALIIVNAISLYLESRTKARKKTD